MSTARRLTPRSICLFCRLSSRLSKPDTLHTRASLLRRIPHGTQSYNHSNIRQFSTTVLRRNNAADTNTDPPSSSSSSTTNPRKSNISTASLPVVEAARIKWQDTLPIDHLSPADQRLWDTLYGAPKRIWTAEETVRIEGMLDDGLLLEEAVMIIDGVDNAGEELEGGYTVENGVITYHGPVDEDGRPLKRADAQERNLDADADVEGGEGVMGHEPEVQDIEEVAMEGDEGVDGGVEYNEYPISQDPDLPLSQRILQAEALAKALGDPTDTRDRGKWEVEEEEGGQEYVRTHPMTARGRFATQPSTVFYPRNLQVVTSELLKSTKFEHFKERAWEYLPPALVSPGERKRGGAGYHPNLGPETHRGDRLDASVWLGVVMPEVYSVNLGVATEVRRRLGGEWALGVKKVLDVGGGGAGIIAWGDVVKAETMAGEVEEDGKDGTWDWGHGVEGVKASAVGVDEDYKFEATVVTANPHVRGLASKILQNTTFLPRTPYFSAPPAGLKWERPEWERQKDGRTDIENPDEDIVEPFESMDDKKQPPVAPKRSYDLIFASYTLEHMKHKNVFQHHVDNLWQLLNPGGVLCIVELGSLQGFTKVAEARQRLLKKWIKSPLSDKKGKSPDAEEALPDVTDFFEEDVLGLKDVPQKPHKGSTLEDGMIVAPCTNHNLCPMYSNKSTIFKSADICRFYQRYQQSPVVRRVQNNKKSDHTDALFSYLAVRRGVAKDESVSLPQVAKKRSAAEGLKPRLKPVNLDKVEKEYSEEDKRKFMHLQPRLILPPIKGDHHVTFDVCTSEGDLERWIVAKSFSKEAYRDARKASWGDLWLHGAKTKTLRHPKKEVKERERVTRLERSMERRETNIRKMQVREIQKKGVRWSPNNRTGLRGNGQRVHEKFAGKGGEDGVPRFTFHLAEK
ncbi:hypothetical protein H072_3361 [Dactylellina haptotyla CBS 200.50]|uniref:37S ribosomal protein S22 n=1 Tax=Dactylellina haptotyla (strain CBS 200.50) TaxID=1284197 RepID=S8AHY2_DACHA|nr:hypothetical protein H072_3361 [Dactylellina haptotyla CBS 200.50]